MTTAVRVVALSGGIGGAKLALGLYRILPPESLLVVCNTGDDFEHLGLRVSPDVDTVMYTLAGVVNPATGWGRAQESWRFMDALAELGGQTWFRLGDTDLATHVERTRRLTAGERLSAITEDFRRRLGVEARLVPMCDAPVQTIVHTEAGPLAFQHYFVRERCAPAVTGFAFAGAAHAEPPQALLEALHDPALQAIILCPSNPFISIDPVLAVPGLRAALMASAAPVIAVSPLIGGRALKGPTAKMMTELGLSLTPHAIVTHYGTLLDGFVLDTADAHHASRLGVACVTAQTWMQSLADREALARSVLDFATSLRRSTAPVNGTPEKLP